jgi:L-glyceraldehyde 3-phosphate reductase
VTDEQPDGEQSGMEYRRVGRSGLVLPTISLGLWQNFGEGRDFDDQRRIVHRAVELGITHLDLANNYGPPPGAAERTLGRILAADLQGHRDQLVLSTKAGYEMWPGPYGDGGSRKYLLASLDQSLTRLGVDYVDIFYSHRFDDTTPLEETMGALDTAVRRGKALYAGISSYSSRQTADAARILRELGTPLLIHQPSYSLVDRWIEADRLLDTLDTEGVGCIVFSPLAQGLLSDRYRETVPEDSRASARDTLFPEMISAGYRAMVEALRGVAERRGQTVAQMALAWTVRDPRVTSALVGVSSITQLEDNVAALAAPAFDDAELAELDRLTTRR